MLAQFAAAGQACSRLGPAEHCVQRLSLIGHGRPVDRLVNQILNVLQRSFVLSSVSNLMLLQTNPIGTFISLSGPSYPGTSDQACWLAQDVKTFLSLMYLANQTT